MSEWRIFRQGECLGTFEADDAAGARDLAERAGMVQPAEKGLWVEPRDDQTMRMRTFIVGVIEAMGLPSSEAGAVADVVLSGRGEVDSDAYLDRIAERFERAPARQRYTSYVEITVRKSAAGHEARGRYQGTDYRAQGVTEPEAVTALKKKIETANPDVRIVRQRPPRKGSA